MQTIEQAGTRLLRAYAEYVEGKIDVNEIPLDFGQWQDNYPEDKKLIGYQVMYKEPHLGDFPAPWKEEDVLSKRLADCWLEDNNTFNEFEIIELFSDEVDEPVFFDGDSSGCYLMSGKPSPYHPENFTNIQSILVRKMAGKDCTEQESAEIKQWVKSTLVRVGGWKIEVIEDIQKHFPLEYGEAIDERKEI